MSFLPCPAPEPIPQHPIPSRPSAGNPTNGKPRTAKCNSQVTLSDSILALGSWLLYKQTRFGLKVVRLDIGIEKSSNRKLRFAYGGKKKSLCPGLRMEGGEDKDEEEALRHGWDIGRM
ncbi:hypothetical protein WAI453_003192 [Rhynchosporium graminicola]